mmetsp:Transcript_59866/g.185531  ORF Transcript_59866/g.185531 Transcript_59866/m.185531 type:complete len:430 (+) Transcript_59866:975-2264(+)
MASPACSPRILALRLAMASAMPWPRVSLILWLAGELSAISVMISPMGSLRACPTGVPRAFPISLPSRSPVSCAACLTAPSTMGMELFTAATTLASTTLMTSSIAFSANSWTWLSSLAIAAGVEYFIMRFRKPWTWLTMAWIWVAKESRALLDCEEYSKHMAWYSSALLVALAASHCANCRVSGFAGCPSCADRSPALGSLASPGATPPRRCCSSSCELGEEKSRARACCRVRVSSSRCSATPSSAMRWAVAGMASSTSRSAADADCQAPLSSSTAVRLPERPFGNSWKELGGGVVPSLASESHCVNFLRHVGWSRTSKPSLAQKVVLESRSSVLRAWPGWRLYISWVRALPMLVVASRLGSSSLRQSWATTSAVNWMGRLPLPRASATQLTRVRFFAQTRPKYCETASATSSRIRAALTLPPVSDMRRA